MYKLKFRDEFWKSYNKLIKGNTLLIKKFEKTLDILAEDPFYPGLKTHKVNTKKHTNIYASSVTGDVRIGWMFNKDKERVVLLLEAGTHSGANQIYESKSS